MKSSILLLLFSLFFAQPFNHGFQSIQISGHVSNERGEDLICATVSVKGTKIATATDFYGKFEIAVPNKNSIIRITSPGYQYEEIRVGDKSSFKIKLKPATLQEEEVKITGSKTEKINYPRRKEFTIGSPALSTADCYASPRTMEPAPQWNTEDYDVINENRFKDSKNNPLSTFSIDVDRASYSNLRRFLKNGMEPPKDAVRIEEMVNYFDYDYPVPSGQHPFEIVTEIADCPWNDDHYLVHIGLQGEKIPTENLPASNLVFLIDVSGSMQAANKLPLLKASFKLLLEQLREQDRVAIVVYAGSSGLVLPSTSGEEKNKIWEAISNLTAGGSTAGAAGINLAYKVAREHFIKGGNNRVILATDGDFNIGVSSDSELVHMIEQEREHGVFLTVLGYGMGNYKDNKMQKLADHGNGNHAYIDDISEAKKVFVHEFGGTLFAIAKDVKIQVEFNPEEVQAYRLIGYENRILNKEDFNNDKKDAGELGSGHTVTALYEIIPAGVKSAFVEDIDPLRYQEQDIKRPASKKGEMFYLKLRYKKPDGEKSILVETPIRFDILSWEKTSENYRFSAAVAAFGMILRDSEFKGNATLHDVAQWAIEAQGNDTNGYRAEFIRMVQSFDIVAKR